MDFGKKVIIAVSLEETSHSHLVALKSLDFLKDAELHFVHVYQTTNMVYGLGEFSLAYPLAPDRKSLEKALTDTLKRIFEESFSGPHVFYKCLFDANPKEKFCLYANEIEADSMIVFTREKHGFFESSFAQYLARHSKCHVLILKP